MEKRIPREQKREKLRSSLAPMMVWMISSFWSRFKMLQRSDFRPGNGMCQRCRIESNCPFRRMMLWKMLKACFKRPTELEFFLRAKRRVYFGCGNKDFPHEPLQSVDILSRRLRTQVSMYSLICAGTRVGANVSRASAYSQETKSND